MAGLRGTFFVFYEIQQELGQGAFGRAVRVRRRRDGQLFVAKITHAMNLSTAARAEVLSQHCHEQRPKLETLQLRQV